MIQRRGMEGVKSGRQVRPTACRPLNVTLVNITSVNICWRDNPQNCAGLHLWVCIHSCVRLCGPMGCGLPAHSVHGIFQARILEWVAISYSRGSSPPRDQTRVFCVGRQRFFTTVPPRKPQNWALCSMIIIQHVIDNYRNVCSHFKSTRVRMGRD